jgi:endonuclease-3
MAASMRAPGTARQSARNPRARRLSPQEQARIAEIFARFERLNPEPKPELDYVSPFTLLVAVVLSAQTTDKAVNKATEALFKVAPDARAMHALGVEGLTPFITSIGLYNSKAKNVIELSRLLLERHGGEVPLTRDALQALPGVGRKTASVVLNELRAEPSIAVDTHVYRVSHRLKLSDGATPDEVEADLMRITPGRYLTRAHHWLILHGRYTCVARRPKCEVCPVADLCPSRALFLGV